MIRNILLIAIAVALVVTGFHFYHEARRGQRGTPPPQTVADILPPNLKAAYERQQQEAAQQQAEARLKEEAAVAVLTTNFSSNGLDSLEVRTVNSGATPAELVIEAGTQFQNAGSLVMTVGDVRLEAGAGETVEGTARVVPLRLTNMLQKAPYREAADPDERLAPLVALLKGGPTGADAATLRTAALLLTENPPLEEIASFPTMGAGDAGVGNPAPEALRASAAGLLDALVLLKSAGVDVKNEILIATDPQFTLEVLVKPETNPAAREFFGMKDTRAHWAFWRDTVADGDPRLKHYGLYGIGRFFPEVAAPMMPAWASDRRILPAYRLSAVYALGFAATPEARAQLDALSGKFPPQTNMGRAVREAIAHIDRRGAREGY